MKKVIQATLANAAFHPGSLPAAGIFDVLEHIKDHFEFLERIRGILVPGGRLYLTVPAWQSIWSNQDELAGHYRRYNKNSLSDTLNKAGFQIEFISYIFSYLPLPIFILRTLPHCIYPKKRRNVASHEGVQSNHRLPPIIAGIVMQINNWEINRLKQGRRIPWRTSLLTVARTPHSH